MRCCKLGCHFCSCRKAFAQHRLKFRARWVPGKDFDELRGFQFEAVSFSGWSPFPVL